MNIGETLTLSWTSRLPAGCGSVSINGRNVSPNGSMTVRPAKTTIYNLNAGGTGLASTTVNVTTTPTVRIDADGPEWRAIFVQAVGTPNTRVMLQPTLDLDLSGYENIAIASGVTVTSEVPLLLAPAANDLTVASRLGDLHRYGAPARDAAHLGPRLFTTTRPRPLFILRGAEMGPDGNHERSLGSVRGRPHRLAHLRHSHLARRPEPARSGPPPARLGRPLRRRAGRRGPLRGRRHARRHDHGQRPVGRARALSLLRAAHARVVDVRAA